MERRVEDILIEEVTNIRDLLLQLIERVTRLETKYSWVSALFGALGGMLAALGMYLASQGG